MFFIWLGKMLDFVDREKQEELILCKIDDIIVVLTKEGGKCHEQKIAESM